MPDVKEMSKYMVEFIDNHGAEPVDAYTYDWNGDTVIFLDDDENIVFEVVADLVRWVKKVD